MSETNIPSDFFSDIDGRLFTECKVCGCDLSDGHTPYTIEKAFKRVSEEEDVTLFEMVICMPCAEKQSLKMSKASRKYMEAFMEEAQLLEKRSDLWNSNWQTKWASKCLLTGREINIYDEYHIVGQFTGNQLMQGLAPFVLGQEFIEEIQENLSAETKEEMNRFGDQFLGPDPTLRELLLDNQFILV